MGVLIDGHVSRQQFHDVGLLRDGYVGSGGVAVPGIDGVQGVRGVARKKG